MAKGQEKKGREKKKPKQAKTAGGGQSEYAKSMTGKSTAQPFAKK